MTAADFNRDGHPDLAVTSYDGHVTVLLGDGQGGFAGAPGSPVSVGGNALPTVVATDLNGDGRPDLAVSDFTSNSLIVLLGDGSGRFAPAAGSPVAVGANPTKLAVGDFNGDGHPDCAVVGQAQGTVSVLLGDGLGGFAVAAGSPITSVPSASAVAVADFNHDGKQDLAVSDATDATVYLLVGNGAGQFSPVAGGPANTAVPSNGAYSLLSETTADFNSDGNADVAVGSAAGQASVLLGDGHGGFALAPFAPFDMNPAGLQVPDLLAGDFNGDGHPDIAGAGYWQGSNPRTNAVSVASGDGSGKFTPAPGSPFKTDGVVVSAAAGDFNGDGALDLAADAGSGSIRVLLNQRALPRSPVGLLTAFDTQENTFHECSATVVPSPNGDVLLTAAHCVFGSGHLFTQFAFAPNLQGSFGTGTTPYGVWNGLLAAPSLDYVLSGNPSYDFAYVRVAGQSSGSLEGTVGSLPIAFNPGRGQQWTVRGYPNGMAQSCTATAQDQFTFSGPSQMVVACPGLGEGASGGSWTNSSNGRTNAIGAVDSQQVASCSVLPGCHTGLTGTYLGDDAKQLYDALTARSNSSNSFATIIADIGKSIIALGTYANPPTSDVAITVTTRGGGRRFRAQAARTRVVKVASARFHIPKRRHRVLRLHLTNAGRRLLVRHGRLAVTLRATTRGSNGKRHAVVIAATLVGRKRP
jgi:hypothetical protein